MFRTARKFSNFANLVIRSRERRKDLMCDVLYGQGAEDMLLQPISLEYLMGGKRALPGRLAP